MLKVDRGNYSSYNPYYDSPQSIGEVIVSRAIASHSGIGSC